MKNKTIKILKKCRDYICGEMHLYCLKISNLAVWKNAKSLKAERLKTESARDRQINTDKIKEFVPGNVYYTNITDSTNLYAKRAQNVPDKSIFIADAQTRGRGRLGHDWSSPSGCGVWMSIYLEPKVSVSDISQLTLIAGLAVSNVIEKSSIKWPNDVLISEKKVAGILTEMSANKDGISHIIVGIGINVNNKDFPSELKDKATSLYLETGKMTERENLICRIAEDFFSMYDIFMQEGFSVFKDDYTKKCVTIDKEVYLIKNGERYKGKAVGITQNGELLADIDGNLKIINSCEVSVRGLLGYV